MAEPKRGSVEAFKAAEKKRQDRVKSKGGFKLFGKAGSFDSEKKAAAKRKFNEKVAAANKAKFDQESVKKFKAAEDRRQTRLRNVNKINPNSPKAKRIKDEANKKRRAEADVEKDLPKSKIATATAVGTTAGTVTSQAKKVSTKSEGRKIAEPKTSGIKAAGTFADAFKKARAKGVGTKFAYNDKMYAAVTKDDISRAGKTSLQDFLNSTKRKDTKLAKAPGQIVKKRSGGMIAQTPKGRMPQISKEKRDRIRNMIASARAGSETIREGGMKEDRLKTRLKERADEARKRNMRLKERSGAAVSDREMKSIIEQMGRSPVQDRMKTGGSVMARGCKLGRKKPTKMY